MAHVISLFNHKGGVSKTTTAFNLGWMLANKSKRVLLVDCDPQCNLTGIVLGYRSSEDISSIIGGPKPRNIRDGLAPAFEAQPKLVEAVECIQTSNPNLFILPGNLGLAENEVILGIAQELSGSLQALRNLPGSLRYLIDKTADLYSIDLVIVDMNPSLGAINQNLLMTSDFFIVPLNPDYFSAMGIESLAKVLPKWRNWALQAQKLNVLIEANYPFPVKIPRFLGSIIQKYRPRNEGAPTLAFQHWVTELTSCLKDKLIPILKQSDLMLPDEAYTLAGFSPEDPIVQMPDFNSLIARSQEVQRPVFELTDEQLRLTGITLDRMKDSMNKFREHFSLAADRVLSLIEYAISH